MNKTFFSLTFIEYKNMSSIQNSPPRCVIKRKKELQMLVVCVLQMNMNIHRITTKVKLAKSVYAWPAKKIACSISIYLN